MDALVALTDGGQAALTVVVSTLPDGRGNGSPLASLVELPSGEDRAGVAYKRRAPGAARHQRRLFGGFPLPPGRHMTATKRAFGEAVHERG